MKHIKTFEQFQNEQSGSEDKPVETSETVEVNESGYIEAMDPDIDTAIMDIRRIFIEWKEGPATEKSDIEPARKELLKYIEKQLK